MIGKYFEVEVMCFYAMNKLFFSNNFVLKPFIKHALTNDYL